MKRQPIVQIDAFANRPFAGNPAAVCLLEEEREPAWMQQVAAEMNLSETAFLRRRGETEFDLRWFTPAVEVDLCGHATLASAHLLFEDGHVAPDATIRFHTLSGVLTARRDGPLVELDFPAEPPEPAETPAGLALGLGAEPVAVSRNRMDLFVELADDQAVRTATPDQGILAAIPVRGIVVTARSANPGFDFVSRFFGPRAGVPEDPVTGSAHCGLAPYWAARLGRDTMVGFQASARGGVVQVRLDGARVRLAGPAVTVLRGELLV